MFYVYVLVSESDGKTYVGATSDLRRRLREHNSGKSFPTSFRKPFKLAYYESFANEFDAYEREKKLKLRGNTKIRLMRRISRSLQ